MFVESLKLSRIVHPGSFISNWGALKKDTAHGAVMRCNAVRKAVLYSVQVCIYVRGSSVGDDFNP